jgi:hypothetical protein
MSKLVLILAPKHTCKHVGSAIPQEVEELTDEQADAIRAAFMTVTVKDKTVVIKDWLDDSIQTSEVK